MSFMSASAPFTWCVRGRRRKENRNGKTKEQTLKNVIEHLTESAKSVMVVLVVVVVVMVAVEGFRHWNCGPPEKSRFD